MAGRWLTPNNLDGADDSRIIVCPISLWPYVIGALQELTEVDNWEKFGTMTPEEMASFFTEALDEI